MCAGFLAGVIADIVSAASCLLLSQVFPHVLDPPLAAHMVEPNQVHSLTSSETTREMDVTDAQRKSPRHRLRLFFVESGNVLLSQVVSNQVPSALKGLTSVFGMGTGGSLSPLSPENCEGFVQSFVFLVSAPSLHNRSFHLGDFPHISRFIFYCAYPENRTSRLLTSRITSFQFSLWSQLNSFRSSPRPISIIKLQMLPLFHR